MDPSIRQVFVLFATSATDWISAEASLRLCEKPQETSIIESKSRI